MTKTTTPKPAKTTGPFADPKVRAKWQFVKGDASAERTRMAKMTKLPFPERVKK
jgi:hypothetical protein